MAIKTNEIITKTDIDSLKQKIKTLYENRTLTVEGRTLSDTTQENHAAILNTNISNNGIISTSNLGALLDACLVINDIPNLVTLAHNEDKYIFHNSSNEDVLTWLSDEKINATGDSSNHGCRGACVGICSGGCTGTSSAGPAGRGNDNSTTGCNTCEGGCYGCSNNCHSGCWGKCEQNADAFCDGCMGGCAGKCHGCAGGCGLQCKGCIGRCTTECNTSCGTECWNGCTSVCSDQCENACQNSCKNQCATDCTSGCYGSATGGTYT